MHQSKFKYETIALYSLQSLTKDFHDPVFVEDAGLFISALNDFPGSIAGYVQDTW